MKNKSIIKIAFLLFCLNCWHTTSALDVINTIHIRLNSGKFMEVQICTDHIVRFRVSDFDEFPETLMERYGIINTDWQTDKKKFSNQNGIYIVPILEYQIIINQKTDEVSLQKKTGETVIERIGFPEPDHQSVVGLEKSFNTYFSQANTGRRITSDNNLEYNTMEKYEIDTLLKKSVVEISVKEDENFYGAGSASRKTVNHRGTALRIWASYQRSEYPIPFLMSSNGWGIFNNTTTKNYFDVARFQPDKLFVYNTYSEVDFYLIIGQSMTEVIELYTTITGKPYLLPKWAYGLAFGSNILENQFNVLDNAKRFRDEQIPCDIYWLEPQWMKKDYDYSINKDWNTDRFQASYSWLRDPKHPKATNLYIKRMMDLGFKTALWLCVDHDLSIEEEDQLAAKFRMPQSHREHWFAHLIKFIDQGIVGFKLDPGRTLNEHPDRKYYNGKTDALMHNLNQVLLQKQMYNTFREHTGLRSFHHYCGGYAGSQRWGASTVGDNGGYIKSLYDVINHSFSGNSNMSIDVLEDVVVKGPGIHYAFFSPWVQLNSWAWLLHPWYYNQHDKKMFRFYAQLRYSLHSYIYSAAINSSVTGQPIIWPMALAFPKEPKFSNTLQQYMFGKNLLIGVYTDSVYLPEGNWIDYWTGKKYSGQKLLKCEIPTERGGLLFIKSGAIIPFRKPIQYICDKPVDTLIVRVYPEGSSSYTLLEDDGKTFDYENGKIAQTRFECIETKDKTEFIIHPCVGSYSGILDSRTYQIEIKFQKKPRQVLVNGNKTKKWIYDMDKIILKLNQENIFEKQVVTILHKPQ